jgi:hypothetical protein
MASWERKRQPDDVPTPVAVAVSDFCRRAGAPASPREVRDALSTVTDADEVRIRAVTDAEPPVRPLGPFAVVDLARGTSAELAGLRQRAGYYALVEELLAQPADADRAPTSVAWVPSTLPSASPPTPPALSPEAGPEAPPPRGPPARPSGEPRTTVAERIAPRRRAPAPDLPPAPRGRYTQVASQRAPLESLNAPEGRSVLEPLLFQHDHRIALTRALAQGYLGRRGGDPLPWEVEELLAAHGLLAAAELRERELIRAHLSEHRGALGRMAWALGLPPAELRSLIERLGLEEEVERARERFRREALAPAHWTARLDLLGRRKYLEDLGLQPAFEERLRADLALELARADAGDPERIPHLARRLGVPPELLARTLSRLGLAPQTGEPSSPP